MVLLLLHIKKALRSGPVCDGASDRYPDMGMQRVCGRYNGTGGEHTGGGLSLCQQEGVHAFCTCTQLCEAAIAHCGSIMPPSPAQPMPWAMHATRRCETVCTPILYAPTHGGVRVLEGDGQARERPRRPERHTAAGKHTAQTSKFFAQRSPRTWCLAPCGPAHEEDAPISRFYSRRHLSSGRGLCAVWATSVVCVNAMLLQTSPVWCFVVLPRAV